MKIIIKKAEGKNVCIYLENNKYFNKYKLPRIS
jgi:hypothetical protein